MPINRRWLDPKTVELSNDVPQAYQSGTGASPNPQRPEIDPEHPAPPTRLGEPRTTVNRLGAASDPEQEYRNEREKLLREGYGKGQQEVGARFGDEAVEESRAEYDAWKQQYDRMNPEEQARELRNQERFAQRQVQVDEYAREQGLGEGSQDDTAPGDVEDRRLKHLMRRRDRAGEQIKRSHRTYERGR